MFTVYKVRIICTYQEMTCTPTTHSYQKRATKEALCQPQTLQTKMHKRYRTYSCLLDPLRFLSKCSTPKLFFKSYAGLSTFFPNCRAPMTSSAAQFLGFFSVLLQPGQQGMAIGHCHVFQVEYPIMQVMFIDHGGFDFFSKDSEIIFFQS